MSSMSSLRSQGVSLIRWTGCSIKRYEVYPQLQRKHQVKICSSFWFSQHGKSACCKYVKALASSTHHKTNRHRKEQPSVIPWVQTSCLLVEETATSASITGTDYEGDQYSVGWSCMGPDYRSFRAEYETYLFELLWIEKRASRVDNGTQLHLQASNRDS